VVAAEQQQQGVGTLDMHVFARQAQGLESDTADLQRDVLAFAGIVRGRRRAGSGGLPLTACFHSSQLPATCTACGNCWRKAASSGATSPALTSWL
jgi:hypothetical protein